MKRSRVGFCLWIGLLLSVPSYHQDVGSVGAQARGISDWERTQGPITSITMSFVSDTTWESFGWTQDGGKGASAGPAQYVCLRCQASFCPPGATIFFHEFCGWPADLSPIPGAAWIWRAGITGATRPASLEGAYFTKLFEIPGLPTAGEIQVAVDDFAEVDVNGVTVGSTGSITDGEIAIAAQRALTRFDIGPQLVQGVNRIVIRARNFPCAAPASTGSDVAGSAVDSLTGRARDGLGQDTEDLLCSYSAAPAGVVFGGTIGFVAPTRTRTGSWGSLKALFR